MKIEVVEEKVKRNKYTTCDGNVFYDKEEAKNHENGIIFKNVEQIEIDLFDVETTCFKIKNKEELFAVKDHYEDDGIYIYDQAKIITLNYPCFMFMGFNDCQEQMLYFVGDSMKNNINKLASFVNEKE